MNFQSVEELAVAADRWCRENQVSPASGQASNATSARTVRYYRTLALLDAPNAEADAPYGEKHFLQLIAVRLLQAKGLPLSRIQELLIGRKLDQLRRIQRQGLKELEAVESNRLPPLASSESWRMIPIDEEWLLVSRRDRPLSPSQLSAIRAILAPKSATAN